MAGKEARTGISDLKAKLDLLARRMNLSSRNELIGRICVARPTLSENSFRQMIKGEELNSTYRQAVGEHCGFDGDDPVFITGATEEFERLLDRKAERRIGHPLRATIADAAWSRDVKLASFELLTGQWTSGQPYPISINLICRPGPMGSVDVAVRRATVELVPLVRGKPLTAAGQKRLDASLAPRLKTDDLGITVESDVGKVIFGTRASGQSVAWDVRAEAGYIGRPKVPDNLCEAANLADGDSVKGRLVVYLLDLEPVPLEAQGNEADLARDGPSVAFTPVGEGKLDRWTRTLLLKRLAEKEKFGTGVSEIEMCRDEVHFQAIEHVAAAGERKDD